MKTDSELCAIYSFVHGLGLMAMKRRRQLSDTGPRWDEPGLRVTLVSRSLNAAKEFSAEEVTHMAQMGLAVLPRPSWQDDPAYHWRRK